MTGVTQTSIFNSAAASEGQTQNKMTGLFWDIIGGNNEKRIGMNANICRYVETLPDGTTVTRTLLFDAGSMTIDSRAPETPELADCDTAIPDLRPYLYRVDDPAHKPDTPIDSIFLTHNHADHTAALPFLALDGYKLPKIYATPYTARRLEQDFSNSGLRPEEWPEIYTIAPGRAVEEGPVKVWPFWVSHSTPQSVGFMIETPQGNILNMGDFKLDQSVTWGPSFNEAQFRRMVTEKPVDLLVMDSTGADRNMDGVTEEDVRQTLRGLMDTHTDKRFVVAVMSGFEENMATVARIAAEKSRKLWVAGWAHEQALDALTKTGLTMADSIGMKIDVKLLEKGANAETLASMPPGHSVIVMTGANGMSNAALTRAAEGNYPALKLDPATDIILFCATSIPGQESTRERLIANLRNKGFTVLTKNDAALYTHAHARLPEMLKVAEMVKARKVLPSHGDKNLRDACAREMQKAGHATISAANGETLAVSRATGTQSLNPEKAGAVPILGFKTLTGKNWSERNYLMIEVPAERKPQSPQNNGAQNNNEKKRPKIFTANRR